MDWKRRGDERISCILHVATVFIRSVGWIDHVSFAQFPEIPLSVGLKLSFLYALSLFLSYGDVFQIYSNERVSIAPHLHMPCSQSMSEFMSNRSNLKSSSFWPISPSPVHIHYQEKDPVDHHTFQHSNSSRNHWKPGGKGILPSKDVVLTRILLIAVAFSMNRTQVLVWMYSKAAAIEFFFRSLIEGSRK